MDTNLHTLRAGTHTHTHTQTHTHTHTNTHTDDPHRINFKKPGRAPACGQRTPGLKIIIACSRVVVCDVNFVFKLRVLVGNKITDHLYSNKRKFTSNGLTGHAIVTGFSHYYLPVKCYF